MSILKVAAVGQHFACACYNIKLGDPVLLKGADVSAEIKDGETPFSKSQLFNSYEYLISTISRIFKYRL